MHDQKIAIKKELAEEAAKEAYEAEQVRKAEQESAEAERVREATQVREAEATEALEWHDQNFEVDNVEEDRQMVAMAIAEGYDRWEAL